MSFTLVHKSNESKDANGKSSKTVKSSFHRDNNLAVGSHDSTLYLQQTIDNQDVQRLEHSSSVGSGFNFARIDIHPKLKVSQPDDPYEQEADRVSEQVMRMNMPSNLIAPGSKDGDKVSRKCSACEMKDEEKGENLNISRKSTNSSNLETDDVMAGEINNVRSSGGQLLGASTRAFMESRFGHDFGNVRIHTDDRSVRSANSVNALAYAIGNDIVFGEGQYQPNTNEGKRLIAHELTHVIQQGTGFSLQKDVAKLQVGTAGSRDILYREDGGSHPSDTSQPTSPLGTSNQGLNLNPRASSDPTKVTESTPPDIHSLVRLLKQDLLETLSSILSELYRVKRLMIIPYHEQESPRQDGGSHPSDTSQPTSPLGTSNQDINHDPRAYTGPTEVTEPTPPEVTEPTTHDIPHPSQAHTSTPSQLPHPPRPHHEQEPRWQASATGMYSHPWIIARHHPFSGSAGEESEPNKLNLFITSLEGSYRLFEKGHFELITLGGLEAAFGTQRELLGFYGYGLGISHKFKHLRVGLELIAALQAGGVGKKYETPFIGGGAGLHGNFCWRGICLNLSGDYSGRSLHPGSNTREQAVGIRAGINWQILEFIRSFMKKSE